MSSTLSRKYRPQTFAEVIGQAHIKITLQNEIALRRVAHSYLFSGPRGIGKTTLARIFAKSVNCTKRPPGEGEPCDMCDSCVSIREGRSLDVIEIDAASHTGVDHVRGQIIETARFSPHSAPYKVYIIDEVHMLSGSAFNALLKTIEEPPPQVIFILATTEAHRVPQTILSRCQRFDLRPLDVPSLTARLEGISRAEGFVVDPEVLKEIAIRSGGYLRDAESLLAQLFGLGERHLTWENAELVMPRGDSQAVKQLILQTIEGRSRDVVSTLMTLYEEGTDMELLLTRLVKALREVVIFIWSGKRTLPFEELFGNESEATFQLFHRIKKEVYLRLLSHLLKAFEYQRVTPLPPLPLELALLSAILDGQQNDQETPVRDQAHAPPDAVLEPISPDKWQQVLNQSATLNHSLHLALSGTAPRGVKGNTIVLETGYAIFQQKLENHQSRNLVEKTLSEIFGKPVTFTVERGSPPASAPQAPADETIDTLIQNFGGAVAE